MIGGGRLPRSGEVTLSHNGVYITNYAKGDFRMKKFAIWVLTLVLITLGTAIADAAPQADLQSSSFGIIDVNKLMAESPKVKALQEQLNTIGKTYSAQLDAEKPLLSTEEFQTKQTALYQDFLRQKIDLEGQIDQSIKQALAQVAKEKKIIMIFYKNGVIYGGTDITAEVISKMQYGYT
jgi:outer membrane protein